MKKEYNDFTSEKAIGFAHKEWKSLARAALLIRSGNCDPDWANEKKKSYTGIYRRLLEDPIEYVQKEAE